jgi:hypothetical protein
VGTAVLGAEVGAAVGSGVGELSVNSSYCIRKPLRTALYGRAAGGRPLVKRM